MGRECGEVDAGILYFSIGAGGAGGDVVASGGDAEAEEDSIFR